MVNEHFIKFLLPDRSYQALVRAEIKKLAETMGFKDRRLGEVEIIIAEITTNLIKHTPKGGMILVRQISKPDFGLELIAIDDGPGMKSPLKMLEDGHST